MESITPGPLRVTWDEFVAAIRAPAYEDFDALYWVCRLTRDVLLSVSYCLVGPGRRRRLRSAMLQLRPVM